MVTFWGGRPGRDPARAVSGPSHNAARPRPPAPALRDSPSRPSCRPPCPAPLPCPPLSCPPCPAPVAHFRLSGPSRRWPPRKAGSTLPPSAAGPCRLAAHGQSVTRNTGRMRRHPGLPLPGRARPLGFPPPGNGRTARSDGIPGMNCTSGPAGRPDLPGRCRQRPARPAPEQRPSSARPAPVRRATGTRTPPSARGRAMTPPPGRQAA